MSLVQSTPEELEYLCKCLSVDAEELAASAAALIENLGALPPKCEARLYWRSLVKEATFNLTDVDETVVALLNRLDNVAAAAGVDAPDNALLVGVRRLRWLWAQQAHKWRQLQARAALSLGTRSHSPADSLLLAPGAHRDVCAPPAPQPGRRSLRHRPGEVLPQRHGLQRARQTAGAGQVRGRGSVRHTRAAVDIARPFFLAHSPFFPPVGAPVGTHAQACAAPVCC